MERRQSTKRKVLETRLRKENGLDSRVGRKGSGSSSERVRSRTSDRRCSGGHLAKRGCGFIRRSALCARGIGVLLEDILHQFRGSQLRRKPLCQGNRQAIQHRALRTRRESEPGPADRHRRYGLLFGRAVRRRRSSTAVVPVHDESPVSNEKISVEYRLKRFVEGSLLPADEAHTYWNGAFSRAQQQGLLYRMN